MTPLRFGIMGFGTKLAAWEARCVRQLVEEGLGEPALLIVNPVDELEPVRNPAWKRFGTLVRSSNALWISYERMMEPRMEALKPLEASGLLKSAARITCSPDRKGKFSEYFAPADVEAIRAYNLDFILRFAYNIIRGDILQAARYGVWSFHHDDEEKYRGGPPGFWEIYHGDPQTGAVLQRLTDRLDGGIILKKGSFPTNFHSWARNRDVGLWGSAGWPCEVCREILRGDYVETEPSRSAAPVFRSPTNAQMLQYVLRSCWFAARREKS